MTLSVSDQDDAHIAALFPPCAPDTHSRSAEHHAGVRLLAAIAHQMGADTWTVDLAPWGRPDLLLQVPGHRPWLIEYKTYRPDRHLLRHAVLQTYGYAAALGTHTLERALLVLGGTGHVTHLPIPAPLDLVQVVTPRQYVDLLVDQFCDDGMPIERVTRDATPTPPRTEGRRP